MQISNCHYAKVVDGKCTQCRDYCSVYTPVKVTVWNLVDGEVFKTQSYELEEMVNEVLANKKDPDATIAMIDEGGHATVWGDDRLVNDEDLVL